MRTQTTVTLLVTVAAVAWLTTRIGDVHVALSNVDTVTAVHRASPSIGLGVLDQSSARLPISAEPIANSQPVDPELHPAPVHDVAPLSALEAESLKTEIETSLVGQLDPGRFLDAALELTELEVGKTPLEGGLTGVVRYPVLGTPEGVTAELWVQDASHTQFGAAVLTYKLNVAPPDNYMFEGAARANLSALMTVWTDKSGDLKHFNVVTDCQVSGKSRAMGLDWMGVTLPTGVFYSYAPDRPFDTTYHNRVLRNGVAGESSGPLPKLIGEWPRTDDLVRVKDGLHAQYGSL